MASRKEQKDQAREARLAREKAAAEKAARNRRIQIFGGAVVVAIIVIVVAVVISSSSGSSGTGNANPKSSANRKIDATVESELKGVPQHGLTLGNPKAKVTMQYFGDLQCPICADFTKGLSDGGGFPKFIANQVKAGDVKVVYKSFCTATCSPTNAAPGGGQAAFTRQQVAAYAAGAQNKFWNFLETFYREQGGEDTGYVTPSFIGGIAKQVPGLNLTKWTQDRKDPTYQQQISADNSLANHYRIDSTPSLIMVGPKGKEAYVDNGNYPTYDDLVKYYKQVL